MQKTGTESSFIGRAGSRRVPYGRKIRRRTVSVGIFAQIGRAARHLVVMALAKLGREPEQQVDAFQLVQPILAGIGDLVRRDRGPGERAGRSECLGGDGPIARQGTVAHDRDEFEIFVEEENGGDAEPTADLRGVGEFGRFVPIDESQVDRSAGGHGSDFGELLEERALMGAVAAPCAAENEDVDAARERFDQVDLGLRQRRMLAAELVEVIPGLLLMVGAAGDVRGVRNGLFEGGLQERWIDHVVISCGRPGRLLLQLRCSGPE